MCIYIYIYKYGYASNMYPLPIFFLNLASALPYASGSMYPLPFPYNIRHITITLTCVGQQQKQFLHTCYSEYILCYSKYILDMSNSPNKTN